MNPMLEPLSPDAREAVIDIFNHHVEHGFAAYPENPVPYAFFDTLLNLCAGYPAVTARNQTGEIIGFGLLRPFNPIPTFSGTAEISTFLKPGYTGSGVGTAILDHLAARGREMGLRSLLAGVSSLNEGSIRFHIKNGFTECGRFKNVGVKKGVSFDVVNLQKFL